MFKFLTSTPAWGLIFQSDWMCKFILLALFIVSVACIAIIIFKVLTLKAQKQSLIRVLEKIKKATSVQDLLAIGKENSDNFGGRLILQSLNELKSNLEKNPNQEKKITLQEVEYFDLLINQSIDELIIEGEAYIPVLSTSGAVATLVGLFGTVWGLIHAFINISQEKSADISVVAPGIAEALITTLAGLIVAIPALIAFYYLSNEIRKIEQQLTHISQIYINLLRQTFVK